MRIKQKDWTLARKLIRQFNRGFNHAEGGWRVNTTTGQVTLNDLLVPDGENDLYDMIDWTSMKKEDIEPTDEGKVAIDCWVYDRDELIGNTIIMFDADGLYQVNDLGYRPTDVLWKRDTC
jgi:hypothetical protein|tara:strand:+ start:1069 stop:1428 length:360 start_codon:yes stop_codon:yes gene_type:complete